MSTLEQIDKDVSQKVQGIPGFLQEQDIPRLLQEQDIPGFLQEQGLGILGPFEMNETGNLSWALGCSDLNQTDEIMVEACSYWIEGVTLVSNVLWTPHPPPLKKNNLLCFLSITESQTITKIKQYSVLYFNNILILPYCLDISQQNWTLCRGGANVGDFLEIQGSATIFLTRLLSVLAKILRNKWGSKYKTQNTEPLYKNNHFATLV